MPKGNPQLKIWMSELKQSNDVFNTNIKLKSIGINRFEAI